MSQDYSNEENTNDYDNYNNTHLNFDHNDEIPKVGDEEGQHEIFTPPFWAFDNWNICFFHFYYQYLSSSSLDSLWSHNSCHTWYFLRHFFSK